MHRRHRKLMNPAFSIAHMKRLIPLFNGVSKQARLIMAADIKRTGRVETDALEYMSRVALVCDHSHSVDGCLALWLNLFKELIAQGGFGHSFNALDSQEGNVLRRALNDFPCALPPVQCTSHADTIVLTAQLRTHFSGSARSFLYLRARSHPGCFAVWARYYPSRRCTNFLKSQTRSSSSPRQSGRRRNGCTLRAKLPIPWAKVVIS